MLYGSKIEPIMIRGTSDGFYYENIPFGEIKQIVKAQGLSFDGFSKVAGDYIKKGDKIRIWRRGEPNRVDARFEEIKGKKLWLTGTKGVKISIPKDQILIINAASSPVTGKSQGDVSGWVREWAEKTRQDDEKIWGELKRLFEGTIAGMTGEDIKAVKIILEGADHPLETALAHFEEDILRTKERTEWTHLIRGRFMQMPTVLSLLTGAGYFEARRGAERSLQENNTTSHGPVSSPMIGEGQGARVPSTPLGTPFGRKEQGIVSGEIGDTSDAPGGIDLNPALLDLQIRRDGNGVPLPLPQQPIENMHIEGFLPIIINVTPVTNLPMLLGLADSTAETQAITATPDLKASQRPEVPSREEPVGREVEPVSLLN